MIKPTMLLSPVRSFNGDGATVEPEVGSTVTLFPGRYGYAWRMSTKSTSTYVRVPYADAGLTPDKGAILVRFKPMSPAPATVQNVFALGINGGTGRWISVIIPIGVSELRIQTVNRPDTTVHTSDSIPITIDEDTTAMLSWADDEYRLDCNGQTVVLNQPTGVEFSNTWLSMNRFNNTWTLTGYVESALTFTERPPQAQIDGLIGLDEAWGWRNTFGPFVAPVAPVISSGLAITDTEVYQSDMFGTVGDKVEGTITNCRITSDIDRAGSKNRVELAAVGLHSLLPSSSWVTIYQNMASEGMGIRRVRRGTFQLGQPVVSKDGAIYEVNNGGNDIVDLLARSALLDTYVTPIGGTVMPDIELAIRMLGITSMGPNLIANNSFEGTLNDWSVYATSTNSSQESQKEIGPWRAVQGEHALTVTFGPTATAGVRSLYQDVGIPAGATKLYVSGFNRITNVGVYGTIGIEWRNSGGEIDVALRNTVYPAHVGLTDVWGRAFAVVDVPEGATIARTLCVSTLPSAIGGTQWCQWDDIRVGVCTGDLLPQSMLALPASTAVASSRMQHLTSDTRLAAVNDRLAALGMMAVNATPDNKFTSRGSRDPSRDDPSHTYDVVNDIRLFGELKTARSTSNQYNRVFAIKEDFSSGTSLIAVAENDDIDDPWSIHHEVLAPKAITIQDAVSLAELQELADAELAKASIQESITFEVMPNPFMTVYDLVRIVGPAGSPVVGVWAVESIDSGAMVATSSPMIVGARRTIGSR